MRNVLRAAILFLLLSAVAQSQVADNNYTDIGNIGLAITSFGRIGNTFSQSFWPAQPSCEYPTAPVRSRIEHLFSGGLWIGGYKNGQGPFISTTTTNYYSNPSEFTQPLDSGLTERSSLLESCYYSPSAVSHQDFVADYTDLNTVDPGTGQELVGHIPLDVSVHQESYAWEYPSANFFVILSFTVKNTESTPVDSMFVGFVNDFVVRNTNYRLSTEGAAFYSGTGLGYVDSLRLAYAFDAEHKTSDLPTDNYVSVKLLGVDPLSSIVQSRPVLLDSLNSYTHFAAWYYNIGSTGDPNLIQLSNNDATRFEKMETSLPSDYYNNPANPSYLGKAGNRYTLLSVGKVKWITFSPGSELVAPSWRSNFSLDPTKYPSGKLPDILSGIFVSPEAVMVDDRSNIYVVDSQLDSLMKFDSNGKLLHESFGPSKSGGALSKPSGVTYFNKVVYISDKGHNRILRYELSTDFR